MTRATTTMTGLVLICFLALQPLDARSVDMLRALLGVHAAGMLEGRFWSLLTYVFLHGGPTHIVLNLVTLLSVGPEVERAVGSWRWIMLYMLAGMAGALAWLLSIWPVDTLLIGASAAICGLLGALAALHPRRKYALVFLPIQLPVWVIISVLAATQAGYVMLAGTHGPVAYVAHLAGGLAGFVVAMAFRRRAGKSA